MSAEGVSAHRHSFKHATWESTASSHPVLKVCGPAEDDSDDEGRRRADKKTRRKDSPHLVALAAGMCAENTDTACCHSSVVMSSRTHPMSDVRGARTTFTSRRTSRAPRPCCIWGCYRCHEMRRTYSRRRAQKREQKQQPMISLGLLQVHPTAADAEADKTKQQCASRRVQLQAMATLLSLSEADHCKFKMIRFIGNADALMLLIYCFCPPACLRACI